MPTRGFHFYIRNLWISCNLKYLYLDLFSIIISGYRGNRFLRITVFNIEFKLEYVY